MVEQSVGGTNSEIVYSPAGVKLALMNGSTLTKAFVPLTGGDTAVYTSSGLAYFRHTDHLGSSRLASTATQTQTPYSETAYSPFGEPYASSGGIDPSFTGQNQDTTSGLYDFLYREQDPNQSRWVSLDPFANQNAISNAQCSNGTLSVSVDGNNHINSSNTFAYDAAGNMTEDGKGSNYSYTFDAENRLILASGMSGGPYCYVYDGNGLRVAKKSGATSCSSGTVTKLYWRSISGDALAESDGSGSVTNGAYTEYVFLAGRRVASRNGVGAIFYYFADQLGSTRSITTGSGPGQTPGQLCYDADFTPYGEEISHTERLQATACPPSYKFTGYERDPETAYGQTDTGLDYAFARYYSNRLGRFLSTDPLGGAVGDLQSHNAYTYVLNNPSNNTDPLGLWCSANVGESDTPCNPYNSGDGSGPQDPGVADFGDPNALAEAEYLASIPGYSIIGGNLWLMGSFSIEAFIVGEPQDGVVEGANGIFQEVYAFDLGPLTLNTGGNTSGPSTPTPAVAATKFCEEHGQVASTIRGTNIPITASLSATAGPVNYNTKNEITPVIPAFPWPEWLSFGAGIDVGINVPAGSAPSWSVGLGKNAGVSFFTNAKGKTTGVNLNFGISIGPPVTVSPGSANACGLRAGG